MFFTAFALCILRLFKLKTEGETIYRKLTKLQ